MIKTKQLQIVRMGDGSALCEKCGARIHENMRFAGEIIHETKARLELYKCKCCNKNFWLKFELFDEMGHIEGVIFSSDNNDPNNNFEKLLTKNQIDLVKKHLENCTICQQRRDKTFLRDVWMADFITQIRKHLGIKKRKRCNNE